MMTAVAQQPGIDEVDNRPSVVEALAKVMNEIRAVGKDQKFSAPGMGTYDFRGIDAVMNAAGPALRKHKVIVVPIVEKIEYRDVRTANQKPAREVTLRVRYRFHGPRGDYLDAVVCGESMDSGDKGTAKAMSVAYRTALLQVLCLPTHDTDPDAQGYERGTGRVDVSVESGERDAKRLDRKGLLRRVRRTLNQERELRGESVYALLDRVASYCKETLGVNIIKTQNDDGVVEEVDWEKLSDGKLSVLYAWSLKSIEDIQEKAGVGADDGQEA
jgi:hypothetical protein